MRVNNRRRAVGKKRIHNVNYGKKGGSVYAFIDAILVMRQYENDEIIRTFYDVIITTITANKRSSITTKKFLEGIPYQLNELIHPTFMENMIYRRIFYRRFRYITNLKDTNKRAVAFLATINRSKRYAEHYENLEPEVAIKRFNRYVVYHIIRNKKVTELVLR